MTATRYEIRNAQRPVGRTWIVDSFLGPARDFPTYAAALAGLQEDVQEALDDVETQAMAAVDMGGYAMLEAIGGLNSAAEQLRAMIRQIEGGIRVDRTGAVHLLFAGNHAAPAMHFCVKPEA